MKIHNKIISTLCVALCAMFLISGCANTDITVKCDWDLAELGNDVSFHTQAQTQYLEGNYKDISLYAKGDAELSRPEAVRISWAAEPEDQTAEIAQYTVEIEDEYNKYNSISFTTSESYVDVYNLCIGTKYFWRVTGIFTDGRTSVSPWANFSTSDKAPRNLYIDGITNVRDLGGWETPEGKVRQGMIYRCGRLNKSETPEVQIEITEDGIDTMRNLLGVKTEIDLRMPTTHNTETGGITSSPLGEDINYFNCPLEWEKSNVLMENLPAVREFFSYVSDINNYPLIFHCNIGTDRTGMFAFLINGLLGVSEVDLYRDYLFSNFGKINLSRSISSIQSTYLATIKNYSGDTLSERIENCLLELVGVPQSEIDAIKSILSE